MSYSFFLLAGLLAAGLHPDSYESVTDSLHAVTVTADKGVVVSRKDTLHVRDHFLISEVLQYSPGLHLSDNGGASGLKTVSLRGLGSAHTAIYIDGVRVGNLQSGQNDLGMIGLENCGSAVVDYAQNSISFNTARPEFGNGPVAGTIRMSAGSFATYNPSARLDFRLSDALALSADASYISSRGDYTYGDGLRRANNDVEQVRAGLDLFGIADKGSYHVKAYYNSTDRGTPGSIDWPSEDRQNDMNAYLQGVFHGRFSSLYSLDLSAKVSYDDIAYTSAWGDSRYGQTEVQLNSSHGFDLARWCRLSLAADIQWDGLRSTNYDASRLAVISALASSFRTSRFTADAALEYQGTFDMGGKSANVISPSVDMRYTLMKGLDIVAFGRRAYRVPVFNELYYVGYGNPDLKPEDAWLTDLGVDFNRSVGDLWTLNARLDGFLNLLENKITSAPTPEDPAIWQPYNIGKVRSAGFDAVAGAALASGDWQCSLDMKYTFLSAVDKTPDSYSYGTQIPYVARHSVVVNGNLSWRRWSLSPIWQLRAGRSDGYGALPDWNTLDLSLSRPFRLFKAGELTARITAKNILDNRYETVSGYPMPGRSIICGIVFKFK